MVVFFWVDVVNGFFPRLFLSFLGQTHWESFWKKIQLILQFFWEEFIKKIILICIFIKKTLVVVVVVIMGFRRIPLGENWARSFGVSSLSWTFSRWRLKMMRLVRDKL
jgi:hypothetical protein